MRELICAGGAAALAGCAAPGGAPGGSCNANPDPCCYILNNGGPTDLRKECDLRDACERAGGNWSDPEIHGFMTDAGTPYCRFGDLDAGVPPDAPVLDDAGPLPDAYLPPPPPDAH